jgi:hypothetical protein
VRGEDANGRDLHDMINEIGHYMNHALHNEPLSTDQISSIRFDQRCTDDIWQLVIKAVQLGLLYPNLSANSPEYMPDHSGEFRLGYVLSPHFRILPRRGAARNLSIILADQRPYRKRRLQSEIQATLPFEV